ncbi:MAG: hypothetical protein KDD53_12975, partial [Bdellovibrionales bacterium]|nr:hypothetical protein [Bdellovibrionales bacterium]
LAFGHVVSSAGDIDNDGCNDIQVGAPLYHGSSGSQLDSGGVFVYRGSSTGNFTPIQTIDIAQGGDYFGSSISVAGALDSVSGEDSRILIAGAPSGGSSDGGVAYVFDGGSLALPLVDSLIGDGSESASFGNNLGTVDDLSGDGIGDFYISATHEFYSAQSPEQFYYRTPNFAPPAPSKYSIEYSGKMCHSINSQGKSTSNNPKIKVSKSTAIVSSKCIADPTNPKKCKNLRIDLKKAKTKGKKTANVQCFLASSPLPSPFALNSPEIGCEIGIPLTAPVEHLQTESSKSGKV